MAKQVISSSDSGSQAAGKINDNFTELYNSQSGGETEVAAIDYDVNFRSVAHRGLMSVAPENTIPAYRAARAAGFQYAETDVAFTSDGVPVLLHDASINRTSNGTGNLASLTFAQVRQYDFGSWFSSEFAGTQIPSFEEFLVFCKQVGLHPYIEMKNDTTYTQAQIESLVDMVEAAGMKGKVTWISFNATYLGYVKNYDPTARLGLLLFDSVTDANITTANGLKTETNEVFLDTRAISSDVVSKAKTAHIPLETWKPAATTGDWTISHLLACDPYISGITTNAIIGGKLLYEYAMTP